MSEPRLNEILSRDEPSWSDDRHHRVRAAMMTSLPEASRSSTRRGPARVTWLVAAAVMLVATAAFGAVGLRWFASPVVDDAAPQPSSSAPTVTHPRVRVHPQPGARFAELGAENTSGDDAVRVFDGAVTIEVVGRESHVARVLTGDAEIAAADASFDLSVLDDRLRSIRVISGRVEVSTEDGSTRVLEAGERFAMPSEPAAPAPTASSVESASPAPSGSARAAATPSAIPAPSGARPKQANADERAFNEAWDAIERGDYDAAQQRLGNVSPTSPLAEDAEYWRAVALVRSGDDARAREALTRFIAAHPNSPRRAEAEGLLAKLAR